MDARALALALPLCARAPSSPRPRRLTRSSVVFFPQRAVLREKLCGRATAHARGRTHAARGLGNIDSRGLAFTFAGEQSVSIVSRLRGRTLATRDLGSGADLAVAFPVSARVQGLGVGGAYPPGAGETAPALLPPATARPSPRRVQGLLARCMPSEGTNSRSTEKETEAGISGGVTDKETGPSGGGTNKETETAKRKKMLHLAVGSLILATMVAPSVTEALGVREFFLQRLKVRPDLVDGSAKVFVLAKSLYTLLKETKEVSEVLLYFLALHKSKK